MILVTGRTGFVGRAVMDVLDGAHGVSSSDLDLRDGAAVMDLFSEHRPEVVVHLAARVGGILENTEHPADMLIDNMLIDGNLMAALRRFPPEHAIVMLSACMYPDEVASEQYPMDESLIPAGPPPPTNAPYAAAKRALWYGIQALHEQHGVHYSALVPVNIYGPYDHFGSRKSHFLAAAIHKIEQARVRNEPAVDFLGTGKPLRQHVLNLDLARLMDRLVQQGPLDAVVNVGPTELLSIAELARLVAEVAGYEGEVRFPGRGPDGQFRKDVSVARLQQLVPEWTSIETPLTEGIGLTLDWYRSSFEGAA